MGEVHIWIGKDSIAKELLVKRGRIYGDRNELPAAVGIKTGSEILPLMGIGDNVSILWSIGVLHLVTNPGTVLATPQLHPHNNARLVEADVLQLSN